MQRSRITLALAAVAMWISLTGAPAAEKRELRAASLPTHTPDMPGRLGPAQLLGQNAPELAIERLGDSAPIRLASMRGQVVIVEFFATWCEPCRPVQTYLDAMYRQHRNEGLRVIGISHQTGATIERYLASHPVRYAVGRDNGETAVRYRVDALPTLIVIGREGRIREVIEGADMLRIGLLSQALPDLLRQTSAGTRSSKSGARVRETR